MPLRVFNKYGDFDSESGSIINRDEVFMAYVPCMGEDDRKLKQIHKKTYSPKWLLVLKDENSDWQYVWNGQHCEEVVIGDNCWKSLASNDF